MPTHMTGFLLADPLQLQKCKEGESGTMLIVAHW